MITKLYIHFILSIRDSELPDNGEAHATTQDSVAAVRKRIIVHDTCREREGATTGRGNDANDDMMAEMTGASGSK